MWFKLATADFSGNSLGTMTALSKSYSLDTTNLTGLKVEPTYISFTTEGESVTKTLTFTVKTGYTFTSGSTIKLNNSTLIYTAASDLTAGSTFTASITISANASLYGAATATGSSSGDDSGSGTTIAYTSRVSSSGINKTTGEYLTSSTGYVNVYDNIDATKTYYATSYAPSSSGSNACVCYYTSDGTFISAESGSDWGISSVEYTNQVLTVPSNTYTIKLFGRTDNQEAILSVLSDYSLVSYSSQETSVNLNKTTGKLGSSGSDSHVNTYNSIDTSKTYYASGYSPSSTSTAGCICYYTSDGTFISSQDGNDFGTSSEAYTFKQLTVPSTTSTIKIFGKTSGPAALYYKA